MDLNDDSTLPSAIQVRNKRDSTTSHLTQSSSQDTPSRKADANDMRTDIGATTTLRSTTIRHEPLIVVA